MCTETHRNLGADPDAVVIARKARIKAFAGVDTGVAKKLPAPVLAKPTKPAPAAVVVTKVNKVLDDGAPAIETPMPVLAQASAPVQIEPEPVIAELVGPEVGPQTQPTEPQSALEAGRLNFGFGQQVVEQPVVSVMEVVKVVSDALAVDSAQIVEELGVLSAEWAATISQPAADCEPEPVPSLEAQLAALSDPAETYDRSREQERQNAVIAEADKRSAAILARLRAITIQDGVHIEALSDRLDSARARARGVFQNTADAVLIVKGRGNEKFNARIDGIISAEKAEAERAQRAALAAEEARAAAARAATARAEAAARVAQASRPAPTPVVAPQPVAVTSPVVSAPQARQPDLQPQPLSITAQRLTTFLTQQNSGRIKDRFLWRDRVVLPELCASLRVSFNAAQMRNQAYRANIFSQIRAALRGDNEALKIFNQLQL